MRRPHLAVPGPRALVATTGCLCFFQVIAWNPRLVAPGVILLAAMWSLLAVSLRDRTRHGESFAFVLLTAAGVLGALFTCNKSQLLVSVPGASLLATLVVAAGVLAAVEGSPRWRSRAFALLSGVFVLVVLGDCALTFVLNDVQYLLEGGIDALLHGQSPYAITVDNPFPPEDNDKYFGPGVIENGRIMYGYPYLPAPLLVDVPAHLLGDVRWMHLAAMLVVAVIAWRLATDRLGRAAAVLILFNPISTTVLVAYWIEPTILALLAVALWAMARDRRGLGVVVGLFFASKQFAIAYVPALWSVAKSSGWRPVWVAAGVGMVVVGAFVAWDPGAFVHSAVEFHVVQPFRDDSMSLLPGLRRELGTIPAWVPALAPGLGFIVSALVAARTRPGRTAFALGMGLSLLITVLLSKQGHMNYFFLAGGALLLAAVTWREDDPIPHSEDQMREPSSQGSRGVRDIVATR